MKNEGKITQEIKSLVTKSNAILNVAQNKQKVTAYLYIILSLFALSFFGLFAIGPTITTISDLRKQLDQDKEALKQLEDKNAALNSLSAQYVEIQPDLYLLDNAIPQTPQIALLTRQLEALSLKNSLTVDKLDTDLIELFPAKSTTSPIFSYSFSINVKGTEKNINSFISDVINMGRIIGIDRLATGKQAGDLFSASLTGKAFFYKE